MNKLVFLAVCVLLWLPSVARANTIEQAWSDCQASAAAQNADEPNQQPTVCTTRSGWTNYWWKYRASTNDWIDNFQYTTGCTSPATCSDTTHSCGSPPDTSCANKPDITGHTTVNSLTTGGVFCIAGCSYRVTDGTSSTNGVDTTQVVGTFVSSQPVTGSTAGVPCTGTAATFVPKTDSEDEKCVPIGHLSQCFQYATGKMCAITPRGAEACWSPGESNTQVSADQKEALAKSDAGVTPTAPTGLQNAETSTVSNTSTTGTTTTTVTNNITYSNATGVPGTATSTGGTTGGTSTGSTVGHDSAGNCTVDCTNAGTVGGGVGDLYTPETTTVADVVSTYKARVMNAPIISAGRNFLTADNIGGSCPTFSYEFFGHTVTVDIFCNPSMGQVFALVGILVLFGFAYAAFKIALL